MVTLWFITNAGACPDGVDALAVSWTLTARLSGLLARLHIRVLTIAIHIVHLKGILAGLILCIAILLAQLLLLVQQQLLRTVIVHSIDRLVVA